MNVLDRLMLHEIAERPPRIAPPLPDVPAPNDYPFAGSAGAEMARLRARAEGADRILAELRRALGVT